MQDAFEKNWITTAGENVNELERIAAKYIGCKYAVGLSCGTAALHLSIKLAGEKLYGQAIDAGADIFRRGLCLPSDNKMTEEEQDTGGLHAELR